jgi:ABC-type sugar transport system ATPase subunit
VLRDGELISSKAMQDTGQEQIIHDMTGRDLSGLFPTRKTAINLAAEPVLTVSHLKSGPLREASFTLRPGEILGLGGLSGSGRGALLRALMGSNGRNGGVAKLNGQPIANRPADVWRQGMAYIPRERRSQGLMMRRSIVENVALPHLSTFARWRFFLDRNRQKQSTMDQGDQVRLKMTSTAQPCNELSGGNQQKVLFARALAGNPSVLMLDEPTRGVDIGARFDLYRIIRSLSEAGTAIILSSSDLPELIGLSDRIAIMQEGHMETIIPADDLSEGALLSHFYAQPTGTAAA